MKLVLTVDTDQIQEDLSDIESYEITGIDSKEPTAFDLARSCRYEFRINTKDRRDNAKTESLTNQGIF